MSTWRIIVHGMLVMTLFCSVVRLGVTVTLDRCRGKHSFYAVTLRKPCRAFILCMPRNSFACLNSCRVGSTVAIMYALYLLDASFSEIPGGEGVRLLPIAANPTTTGFRPILLGTVLHNIVPEWSPSLARLSGAGSGRLPHQHGHGHLCGVCVVVELGFGSFVQHTQILSAG